MKVIENNIADINRSISIIHKELLKRLQQVNDLDEAKYIFSELGDTIMKALQKADILTEVSEAKAVKKSFLAGLKELDNDPRSWPN